MQFPPSKSSYIPLAGFTDAEAMGMEAWLYKAVESGLVCFSVVECLLTRQDTIQWIYSLATHMLARAHTHTPLAYVLVFMKK